VEVGDLIRFHETGYTGVILGFTPAGSALTFINEDVHFKNPTWITKRTLMRCTEVISSAEADPQS
jgi:hypothetical protein